MADFNLLLVEDNEKEIQTFKDTLERYIVERERPVKVTIAKKLDESLNLLNNDFDGAIVDLKLGRDSDAGNKIIETLQYKFRVPIVVFTANPANVTVDVKVFPRASVEYDEPLDFLFDVYETGLTNIFGGRGYIENVLNRVFWKNVIPQLNDWKRHKSNGKETEKALLRFIINHIVELVDEESDKYFPEEMYITPVVSSLLKTGSIVKKREADQYCVILSPACDLALHNGIFKTDRILCCDIEAIEPLLEIPVLKNADIQIQESDDESTKQKKLRSQEKIRKGEFSKYARNNGPLYYHYLPKTNTFRGGVINFRNLETIVPQEFEKRFESPFAQISSAFTKDIVARFSSYYARQGQPDFDLDL